MLNTVGCRKTQMSAKERKRKYVKSAKSAKGRKRAQTSIIERHRVKIANNLVQVLKPTGLGNPKDTSLFDYFVL